MKAGLVAVCALLACSMVVSGQCFAAEESQGLLPVVVNGCKLAAASVKSCTGRVSVKMWMQKTGGGVLETDADYSLVYSNGTFRLTCDTTYVKNEPATGTIGGDGLFKPGSKTTEAVSFDGTTTRSLFQGQGRIAGSNTASSRQSMSGYKAASPIGNGLIEIDKRVSLPDDAKSDGLRVVGREVVDSDECVLVELKWERHTPEDGDLSDRAQYWVNPAKGFTVPRIRSWSNGGVYKAETLTCEKTAQFRECADGVWVPTQCVHDEYRIDTSTGERYLLQHEVASYDPAFAVNVAVDAADLRLEFPSGTKVYDEVLNAEYVVP